jgi:hypothetical protein
MSTAQSVEKARHLAALYLDGQLTEGALVSGIIRLANAENISELMAVLPAEIRDEVRRWARTTQQGSSEAVFWPLPEIARLSFKEWLEQEELNGR